MSWFSDFVESIGFGTGPGRKAMETPVRRTDRPERFSDQNLQRMHAAAEYVGDSMPPPARPGEERSLSRAREHLAGVEDAYARGRDMRYPDRGDETLYRQQNLRREVARKELEAWQREPERYEDALRKASDAVMARTDLTQRPANIPYDERGPYEAPALRRRDAVAESGAGTGSGFGSGRPIPSVDFGKMRELEIEKARRNGASETKLRVMRENRDPTLVELRILFKEKLLTEDGRVAFDRFLRSHAGSDTHKILGDCATFLGRGAYGTVAKFCDGKPTAREPGKTPYCYSDVCVAVKFQPHGPDAERETGTMRMLSKNPRTRPFVVELLGSRVIDDLLSSPMAVPMARQSGRPKQISVTYMTVYEAPYNSLSDLIEQAPEAEIQAKLPGLVQQVMRAVAVLRQEFPHLRHNDLSPNNVFLDGPNCERAVIGDWGLAQDVKPTDVSPHLVLWHWQPRRGSLCTFEPLWARLTEPGPGATNSVKEVQSNLMSYVLPMDCEYYDWFFFLFWVRRMLKYRNIVVGLVESMFTHMFDNDYVLRIPNYGVLIEGELNDESCTTSYAAFPGRLTGLMQFLTQRAVEARRLPTVADVYARAFGEPPVAPKTIADDDDDDY